MVLRVAFRVNDCAWVLALRARVDDEGLGVLEIISGLNIDAGSSDRLDTSDNDVDDVDDV